jgi:DNA-binding LacI/PurR family transcriptional regulator
LAKLVSCSDNWLNLDAMDRLPQRTSLVAQTVEVLREAIESGQWPQWLPGELELTRRLQVSRVTLRAALAELERVNLIRGGQGRRREIVRTKRKRMARPASKAVVLLSPAPLHQLPSSTVFWMDELRGHLNAAGWPLEVRESTAAYRHRPAHALEEFSERLRPAGWILYRSTPEMQRWFSERGQAAVIAGSRHPDIPLSSVDVDHAAECRHAAGRFLANGHQRLAIVRPDTKLAGDVESVTGFQSGAGAEVPSALHDGSLTGIFVSLDRLFARKPAPTGLFVFHASHFLTVLGWLQRRHLRVPEDMSVVCRDSEPFLESVIPTPTRYELNPSLYARKISRLVAGLVADGPAKPNQLRIMPTFVRGETLGPARSL